MMRYPVVFCLLAVLGVLAPVSLVDGQSLWKRGEKKLSQERKKPASIYVRKTATRDPLKKNDIILVLVLEQASASNDARLDANRKLETELLLDEFVRFSGTHLKPDFSPQPNIDVESERRLRANGKTDRRESVRLRVAARVVDVRDNGNVILEARKDKRINDERTTMVITGEVREADVSADHSVVSDRLADMRLEYHGEGPVSRNASWTWVNRFLDFVWPF